MKRKFALSLAVVVAVVSVLSANVNTAFALPGFKKIFEDKYVKKDSKDPAEMAFAEAVKAVKSCGVCHSDEKDKKKKNAYGMALDPLVEKKDQKDAEKVGAALDKVAEMHSNPDDPSSPTFGDLIKQGKLPAENKPAAE
ncbi:MAG: hypothetical protein K1X74_11875 [Pirellulales bacterium]|nr:hypothetical protein [Pirellulales bacterium]